MFYKICTLLKGTSSPGAYTLIKNREASVLVNKGFLANPPVT